MSTPLERALRQPRAKTSAEVLYETLERAISDEHGAGDGFASITEPIVRRLAEELADAYARNGLMVCSGCQGVTRQAEDGSGICVGCQRMARRMTR